MTATEASRSFAALLDGAERGETTVVTRGGRRIALIGPATQGNGAAFRKFLETATVDDQFESDVLAVRDSQLLDPPAWPAD